MTSAAVCELPQGGAGKSPDFDIVTACRKKDLATLSLALPLLKKNIPHRKLWVFTARANHKLFRDKLGSEVVICDEDEAIPGMTLDQLRREVDLPGFPDGAGWYFQQFLKYSYPLLEPQADRFLIWDADTLPLRPIQPFGALGEACLTPAHPACGNPLAGQPTDRRTRLLLDQATRVHGPYFDNYEHLLGETPDRSHSFIAQHMPIQVACLTAMLRKIDSKWPGNDGWAWKIVRNLRGESPNLFSEYEFYAQYALKHFPRQHRVRPLDWRRGGKILNGINKEEQIQAWAQKFDFVALEAWASPWRRRLVSLYLAMPLVLRNWVRSGI
jgi:hypothetical protein